MSKLVKPVCIAVIIAVVIAVFGYILRDVTFAVLQPRGQISRGERDLILIALGLGLLVVVPVFTMLFAIAWKYRASNTTASYTPDWDHSRMAETVWWTIPSLLILVLSVITWNSTHKLDPFKPLASSAKPLRVQVVSLDWKWLFIYPEQHIATVNTLEIPIDTPIEFEITSDAPMNSFWIPQLSGQIYAMTGMSTQLHVMADVVGNYRGSSANLSGKGFASMNFQTHARSSADFKDWVNKVKQSPQSLSPSAYQALAKPSQPKAPMYFANSQPNLYNSIVLKYMLPLGRTPDIGGDSMYMEGH